MEVREGKQILFFTVFQCLMSCRASVTLVRDFLVPESYYKSFTSKDIRTRSAIDVTAILSITLAR